MRDHRIRPVPSLSPLNEQPPEAGRVLGPLGSRFERLEPGQLQIGSLLPQRRGLILPPQFFGIPGLQEKTEKLSDVSPGLEPFAYSLEFFEQNFRIFQTIPIDVKRNS